jgi:chromosome partitioning protein
MRRMIVTVTGYKGGVSKTTTAIHIAGYLNKQKPALLIDGDANRSALEWARDGRLPFEVVDERGSTRRIREFEHIVIDTQARPSRSDLRELAAGCDLLVVPTTPDRLSLQALFTCIDELQGLNIETFRVLLAIVPPPPSPVGADAREAIKKAGLPLFKGEIRRYMAFQKAALAGQLVSDVADPYAADCWQDYAIIGKEILKWGDSTT